MAIRWTPGVGMTGTFPDGGQFPAPEGAPADKTAEGRSSPSGCRLKPSNKVSFTTDEPSEVVVRIIIHGQLLAYANFLTTTYILTDILYFLIRALYISSVGLLLLLLLCFCEGKAAVWHASFLRNWNMQNVIAHIVLLIDRVTICELWIVPNNASHISQLTKCEIKLA